MMHDWNGGVSTELVTLQLLFLRSLVIIISNTQHPQPAP